MSCDSATRNLAHRCPHLELCNAPRSRARCVDEFLAREGRCPTGDECASVTCLAPNMIGEAHECCSRRATVEAAEDGTKRSRCYSGEVDALAYLRAREQVCAQQPTMAAPEVLEIANRVVPLKLRARDRPCGTTETGEFECAHDVRPDAFFVLADDAAEHVRLISARTGRYCGVALDGRVRCDLPEGAFHLTQKGGTIQLRASGKKKCALDAAGVLRCATKSGATPLAFDLV